jgi:hypothetical protein
MSELLDATNKFEVAKENLERINEQVKTFLDSPELRQLREWQNEASGDFEKARRELLELTRLL